MPDNYPLRLYAMMTAMMTITPQAPEKGGVFTLKVMQYLSLLTFTRHNYPALTFALRRSETVCDSSPTRKDSRLIDHCLRNSVYFAGLHCETRPGKVKYLKIPIADHAADVVYGTSESTGSPLFRIDKSFELADRHFKNRKVLCIYSHRYQK